MEIIIVNKKIFIFKLRSLKKMPEKSRDKKNEPIISAEESLNTTKLIHALYKSDEEKKWIDIRENPVSSRLGKNN